MANIFLFLFNCVAAIFVLALTVVCFIPNLLYAGYRKLLGLDT